MNDWKTKSVGIWDLILMEKPSEDEMYNNVAKRLKAEYIYTYIGEVLVSLNPYKQLPIYGQKVINDYVSKKIYENPPHVYAIAEAAYRNMRNNNKNQCVIISGESGAGKTEASKKLMEYITAVSKNSESVAKVKSMLLESNPILESFGNAKTVRNDNSSRFGKYMEIIFDYLGAPIGGKVTNYLLEKSRVIGRAEGERSFHIFYMILKGAPENLLKKLGLTRKPSDYEYLKEGNCEKIDGVDDSKEWKEVIKAMDILGLKENEKEFFWRIIASILLLGNIQFSEEDKGQHHVAVVDNPSILKSIATNLEIDEKVLLNALTTKTLVTGQKTLNVPQQKREAVISRDSFAKDLYSYLFDQVVSLINKSIHVSSKKKGDDDEETYRKIGVLDIYGFEIFDNNSFEQFCINFCNEKLQQYFIELTLKSEQEEYVKEGIEWENIDYFNNKIICDLIEAKPMSIISLLDEDCRLSKTNDNEFLDNLINSKVGNHEHFVSWKPSSSPSTKNKTPNNDRTLKNGEFKIKHYAGDVVYKVEGFLQKNKDTLIPDCVAALQKSKNELVKNLFPFSSSQNNRSFQTAASKFRNSLALLIETLTKSTPHYIRCIKPNERKKPCEVNEERIRHQIRYLGLMENVRVRRAGFCWRTNYEEFLLRFKLICKDTWPNYDGDAKDGVRLITSSHKISDKEIKFGKTKLFIRNPTTLFYFEGKRDEKLPDIAVKIQSNWKAYAQRKWFVRYIAARKIQALVKMHNQRKRYIKTIATRRIQSFIKMFVQRKKYIRTISARRIQSCVRMFVKKKIYRRELSATKIQFAYRKYRFDKYISQLNKIFDNVINDPHLGKKAEWPVPPKVLQQASIYFKKIHERWRASTMKKRLNQEETDFVKKKIFLKDIFSGKKPWSPSKKFEGNYLEKVNVNNVKYQQYLSSLNKKYNDNKIIFGCPSDRLSSKGKSIERDFILTEKAAYQGVVSKGTDKGILFIVDDVESIEVSSFTDCWVVIKCKAPATDVAICLGKEGEDMVSEFFLWMRELINRKKNINWQSISFKQNITFNNTRTNKKPGTDFTLTFREKPRDNPKILSNSFSKDKNSKNSFTIFY